MADGEFLHTNLFYRLLDRLMASLGVLLARLLTLLDDPGTLVIMLAGVGLCCAIFAWAFGTLFFHLNRTQRRPTAVRATRRAAAPATRTAQSTRLPQPARATRRRRQGPNGAPRSS